MIVISIALGNKEFLYIGREESILCVDETRLYYLMVDGVELYLCKTTTTVPYVCTQNYAVMCSDWEETGFVKLLDQRGNIVR